MIYDILPVNNYQGNNSSVSFDFDFYIDNPDQIKVYLFNNDNTKHELEYGIDYSITGIKDENGGNIIFPLESSRFGVLSEGQKISLELDLPASQETQYNNSSLLNLETLEYSFDYLTRLIQILKRKLSLCVKVEECSESSPQELLDSINEANISTKENALLATESKNSAQTALSEIEDIKQQVNDSCVAMTNFKQELFDSGMFKFNLFDTKISDHILQGGEATGWALQRTWVTGELYPDFYSKCLAEKTAATATSVTLGSQIITMYINQNGHQFYDIADKDVVDAYYSAQGVANFYGLDEENERVFLPGFKHVSIGHGDYTDKIPVVGNGNILGLETGASKTQIGMTTSTAAGFGGYFRTGTNPGNTSTATGFSAGTNDYGTGFGLSTDASMSGVVALLSDANLNESKAYLYYCVGNTVTDDTQINTGAIVSQLENKANTSLNNISPSQTFKNQLVSWAMPNWDAKESKIVNTLYTAPSDGFVSGYTYSLYSSQIEINGILFYFTSGNSTYASGGGFFVPIGAGDTFRLNTSEATAANYYFIPVKGES